MPGSYMPQKLADQVQWAQTFVSVVQPQFSLYGVSDTRMALFAQLVGDLVTAWTVTQHESTRTKVSINQRDELLRQMKAEARQLVSIIQGTDTVTDAMLIAAGLTVRKTTPTPKPAPTQKPILVPTLIDGRVVMVELRQDANKRAKPTDVVNALIFIHEGPTAPTDASEWKFYATVTKTTTTVEFPPSTEFATGWITAFWQNAKGESGPAATPISVVLTPGGMLPSEADQVVTLKAA